MTSDNKQEGSATGFSGLSTLVSDVEAGSATSQPALRGVPPPPTASPTPEHPPGQVQSVTTSTTPEPSKAEQDSSSDATTGKWMVGIGLGIGLLLIFFVNATKNEPMRPRSASAAETATAATSSHQSSHPAPAVDRKQIRREAIIQQSMVTESVSVLGQQVVFSNPSGYCTPGNTAREVELMDSARRSLSEGARLVHAAILCAELDDYREGRRDTLDHWLQIQLLGAKGNFQRVEIPREDFLASLSQSSPRLDPIELNRRLKASFEAIDISLSDMKFEPFGRDGNAVYFSMRMNMSVGKTSRLITGIGGATLLNSLPLTINVYEGDGSPQSRDQLRTIQQELLSSLLTEN